MHQGVVKVTEFADEELSATKEVGAAVANLKA
jgi:hypothetical protein